MRIEKFPRDNIERAAKFFATKAEHVHEMIDDLAPALIRQGPLHVRIFSTTRGPLNLQAGNIFRNVSVEGVAERVKPG